MPFPRLNPAEHLLKRLSWDELDPGYLRKLVEIARDEDLSGLGLRTKPETTGDVSTAAVPSVRSGSADVVARVPLTVCGLGLLPIFFYAYVGSAAAQLRVKDGTMVKPLDVLATLHGDPATLLQAERVLLNFIQRLSGIATFTHEHVTALGSTRTRLLDTRKTTPGHRMLEKYAVACGGGWNHRLGLFDRVMLKDNHLALLGSTGGPAAAVAAAKRAAPELPVEIQVDTLVPIPPALAAGADVLLLHNFTPAQLRRAVA